MCVCVCVCVWREGEGGGNKEFNIVYCPPPVSGESVTVGISGGVVVTLSTSFSQWRESNEKDFTLVGISLRQDRFCECTLSHDCRG